jgi:NarL family two-component system response regulator YdfI
VMVVASSSVRSAGLEAVVKESAGLRLATSTRVTSGISALVREFHPDVALADLERDDPQFLSVAAAVTHGGTVFVLLVDDPETAWVARALRAGARAILPREAEAEEIVSAIQSAHRGMMLLDAPTGEELARHVRVEDEQLVAPLEELTAREVEVLRMLGEGLANKEVAARLGISEHTVKFHISSILDKLGAASRTEAVTTGIRRGLIVV